MKKRFIAAFVVCVLCSLTSCGGGTHYKVPDGFYASSEHFDEKSFRDYTDYCEYYFDENSAKKFEENHYFTLVTKENMVELKSFFQNFSGWIACREGYEEWFNFKADEQMSETDYFFLDVINPQDGKFHNYDIGYYDTETYTLYLFHNNT